MQDQFQVPLIPQDLRHEETIVQIASVLNYLNTVVTDVFDRVNNTINENKCRVDNLSRRIEASSQKVNKLTGTKKATVVFSCTKYPASDVHKNYISVFDTASCQPKQQIQYLNVKIQNKYPELTEHALNEKLQFYHVKTSQKNKCESIVIPDEGLGQLPKKTNSICDLLLFNSSKNPYKSYVQLDPLTLSQRNVESVDTISNNGVQMEAAPLSISQRDVLERHEGENYFYSPGIGDVPSIDVPLDLPDLPGIADDLRYSLESGPGIAPSVTTTPILPDLPNISALITNEPVIKNIEVTEIKEIVQTVKKIETPISPPVVIAPTVPVPPPPPPPPPPPLITDFKSKASEGVTSDNTIVNNANKNKSIDTVPHQSSNVKPVETNMRANLMEAIRNAGGAGKAKLRAAAPRIEKTKTNKKSVNEGSFMDDLHAKLHLRRKGISGSKENAIANNQNAPQGVSDAMTRISAMIPPPLKSDKEATNTDDGEWD